MVFTTLETTPGLGQQRRTRLRSLSPGRVFAAATYRSLIEHAGLSILDERDVTRRFALTLRALIAANERNASALRREVDANAFEGDLRWYGHRLTAVREGLIRRMRYVAVRGGSR